MRVPIPVLLLAMLLWPGSESRAGDEEPEPLLYLKSTELSTFLEENFTRLASGAAPGSLYRAARGAIDPGDEGLVRAGEDRFLLAPLFVRERVAAFRGKALKAWRVFAEPEARGAKAKGGSRPDRETLEALVFRFPNTLVAMESALSFADICIEGAEFTEALDILQDALSWEGPDGLKRRLSGRAGFTRARLDLAPPTEGDSFLGDARNARQLAAAFNRPLGKVRWDTGVIPPGSSLRPVMDGRFLLGFSDHRIMAVALSRDGSPSLAAPVWRFASSILEASCLDGTAFLTSKPEASPWRLHSGEQERPSNRIFALDPMGEGLLWEASPEGLTGPARQGSVFTSGTVPVDGLLVAVTTRRSMGGAMESVLVRIDPRDGKVVSETFLFVKGRAGGKDGQVPGVSWTLVPARGGVLASDGKGSLLLVRDGAVQWVRTYSRVPPVDSPVHSARSVMVVVGNRLLASPRDGARICAIRMRDGSLIASRAIPPVRKLERGEGGSVWVQGEGIVARVHAGDPELRLRSKRAIPVVMSGEGFAFASLFAVPKPGGLLLVGSSGRFLRSLVQPGATPAFLVRKGVLYRLRSDALSAFRIPETMADRALGTIPYIAGASVATARTILIPWLESEDSRLRRWAADLLRETTGRPFDFDPDGPEEERRRAIEALGGG